MQNSNMCLHLALLEYASQGQHDGQRITESIFETFL